MRKAKDLSHEEAVNIVSRIVDAMYLNIDQTGDHCNPDRPIEGADFIETVATILASYGLVPETIEPCE
ncbi:MAG TPA: hypothetical protein VHC22_02085 [Pirellulales bacterium]|nr:hypothetical protein [Pirellulales bacterium]